MKASNHSDQSTHISRLGYVRKKNRTVPGTRTWNGSGGISRYLQDVMQDEAIVDVAEKKRSTCVTISNTKAYSHV
jgi:hypothetical protein